MIRHLLCIAILLSGCTRTVKHEHTVAVKVEGPREKWMEGLTDEQIASAKADAEFARKEFARLDKELEPLYSTDPLLAAAASGRLTSIQIAFGKEVDANRFATAAPVFRKALDGKTAAILAAEQRAEESKIKLEPNQ
jgi:hypothetical protein